MHSYPNFLIVGMMKCGTSTLYEHLTRHPKVKHAATKELHYFSRHFVKKLPEQTPVSAYHDMLNIEAGDPDDMLYGEASPSYIVVPHLIQKHNPDTRIIILMRDPVNRAISQIRQYVHYNVRQKDEGYFAHMLAQSDLSEVDVVRDSEYLPRITRFLELFPKENIAFVSFEALVESPQDVVNQIFGFLKLDAIAIDTGYVAARTDDKKTEDEQEIRNLLTKHFENRRGRVLSLLAHKKAQLFPNDHKYFQSY